MSGIAGGGIVAQSGVAVAAGAATIGFGIANFSNANGVSWGIAGNTVTASVGGFAGAPVNFSAGTTSNNLATIVFSNSNGVSVGLNGSTMTWSVANQTNQTMGLYASSQTTGQSSSSTVDARSLTVVGAGNVSVGWSNSSLLISGAGGGGGAAISAAGSSVNAGTAVWSNSNNVSFGMNGSTITATVTVPAQTNQTGAVYASSQTTGQSSSSTYDARSLSLVGQGIVSVGWSNSSLLVSATTAAQTNQTGAVYASSQTTGQSSSSTYDARSLSLVGAGIVSAGWSNSSLIVSATTAAQTNQSIGLYASSQTTAQSSSSTVDARSLTIVGAGNVSVGLSAGSLIVSGATAAGLTTGGGYVQGNTVGQSSSSTFPLTSFNVSGAGNVSVGWSASTLIVSDSQSAQTEAIYAIGNSTAQSSQSTYTVGSLSVSFAGLVSGGWSNGSLVVSAPNTTSFPAIAISAGTQSASSGTIVWSNSNNVTFGMSNSSVVTASYALNVSAVGGTSNALSGITFTNSNGVSFGLSTGAGVGTLSASVAAQTNQTLGIYGSSQTTGQSSSSTYDARSLTVVGAGNVSVGWSNSSLIVSGAGGGGGAAISAAGNSVNAGTVVFSNSNNVSFGMAGSTVTASYALNVSAVGGTSNALSGITFTNSNGVSFGLSTGAGVGTLSASVAAQTNQTLGFYASSNTTGSISSATYDARSITFIGAGGVSVGNNSTSAGGTTTGFVISAPNTSSLVGTGLVSISTNASTISIGVPIPYLSYYEPAVRGITSSASVANGTVYIQPFVASEYVSAYRLGLLQQITTQAQTTQSFSASVSATGTVSGTGQWSNNATFLLFSRQSTGTNANSSNLISFASTTWSAGVGMSATQSWSTNGGSASATLTTSGAVSFISNLGTAGGATTGSFGTSGSTTYSSSSAAGNTFSTSFAISFASQVMSGFRPINVPMAVSLTPGEYWLGMIQSTASASTNLSLQPLVTFAPGIVVYTTNTSQYADFGATSTNNSNMIQGWGSYSSSGNTTTTFPLSNVSGMSNMQTWFNMMAASK